MSAYAMELHVGLHDFSLYIVFHEEWTSRVMRVSRASNYDGSSAFRVRQTQTLRHIHTTMV